MGGMSALLLLALALTPSKLGVHELGDVQDQGLNTILNACPRAVKFLTPDGNVPPAIALFRSMCPQSKVVLRVYVDSTTHYAITESATADADDFWTKMQGGLAGIDPTKVDWLEGPNELDNLPDWYHDYPTAQWMGQFWPRLAQHMAGAGYHPLVGSIAVGNPALAGENGTGSPDYFQPVADAMKAWGPAWAWSYHAYSQNLSTDVPTESWLSLRYRRIRDECGLAGVPLVLSEGGQDKPGGWQTVGTPPATYLAWLEWLDGQLQVDAEVVGVTLFQAGEHTTWQGFDLGPIATGLAAWIAGGAADAGFPDAGPSDAGAGDGGDGGGGGSGSKPPGTGQLGGATKSGCNCGVDGAALLALFGAAAAVRRRYFGLKR